MGRRLVPVLVATLLFLALQELALRWVFPLPAVLGFDRGDYSPLEPGASEARPASLGHASFIWASQPDGYAIEHRLNLHGFRDTEWTLRPQPGLRRVAFIGDSFVEGFGSENPDTLPAAFAGAVAERSVDVEALNLGVGGAGFSRYAWLVRDALPLLRPRDAILVLYANDLVPEPWDPSALEQGPEFPRTNAWQPRLLHVLRERAARGQVPRRWHTEPFSYLPAVPDPRNPWSHERASARYADKVSPAIADAMREGRFNPALVNWFGWAGEALAKPVDWTPHLRALDAYAREQGTRLFLVYLPSKSQVTDRYMDFQAEYAPGARSLTDDEYQLHARWLARSSAATGLAFLDLTPKLRAAESEDPELYWRYDDHLRPRGYQRVGRWIAEWWLEQKEP